MSASSWDPEAQAQARYKLLRVVGFDVPSLWNSMGKERGTTGLVASNEAFFPRELAFPYDLLGLQWYSIKK